MSFQGLTGLSMHSCTIRTYRREDRTALLQLLALSTPDFFAPEETNDFIRYLEQEADRYFVAETEHHTILACGGVNLTDEGSVGRISWDIVHPDFRGKGIGRRLLIHRLKLLEELGAGKIEVRTSQLAFGFYQKNGFVVQKIVPDYWAKGYDLYAMVFSGKADQL